MVGQRRIGSGLISIILLAMLAGGSPAQTALQPDDPDSVPLWTDRPVRIDPARQDFERLPSAVVIDIHQTGIAVPDHIRVLDSARFAIGKTIYAMRGVTPIDTKRICRNGDGSRWACGRMAAIFLGELVRGRRMQCDTPDKPPADGDTGALTVDCQVRGKRIAQEIIRNGFGLAMEDPDLRAAQDEAMKSQTGLWKNPDCVKNFKSC